MSNESEGDWGKTELDPAERADAEINLDDPSAGDDEPWSPPDRQPRGAELIDVEDESMSVRLRQEEPEEQAGYSDPDNVDMIGDEVDGVPAADDVLGEGEPVVLDDEAGPEAGAMHLEP